MRKVFVFLIVAAFFISAVVQEDFMTSLIYGKDFASMRKVRT